MIFIGVFACFVLVSGNTVIVEPHQPQPYQFGYTIKSKDGVQNREEAGNGAGVVKGQYGFVDNKGIQRHVNYVADHAGFRAAVKTNEPGTANQSPAAVHVMSNDPYAQGAALPYNSRVNDPVVPALYMSDPVYGFPTIYGHKAYSHIAPAPYAPVYSHHQAMPLHYGILPSHHHHHHPMNNVLLVQPQGYLGYGNRYGQGYMGGLAYSNLLGAGYRNQGGIVNYGANLIGGVVKGYDSRFTNL